MEIILQSAVGIVMLVFVCVMIPFLVAYSKQSARNLAAMESLKKLTDIVEGVKVDYTIRIKALEHENAIILEGVKGRLSLSLAALEKRMQAHQEAYELWWRLRRAAHKDLEKATAVVVEAQEWWVKHCIFLDAASREAFWVATNCAFQHKDLVASKDFKLIQQNWDRIEIVGQLLVKGVDLPPVEPDFVYSDKSET